jgi:carboxymethylenebutenolidase
MNHFQKYLIEEFAEDFQEGRISRREALKLIGSITGSLVLAGSILAACAPLEEGTVVDTTEPTTPPPASTAVPAQPTSTSESTLTETPAMSATDTPVSQPAAPQGGTVSPDDPDIEAEDVTISADDGELMAYLAHSRQEGPQPVIMVCHENRGLTEHIKDVTRRLAKAGYTALAMDLLSRLGGISAFSADEVPGALSGIAMEQYVKDFVSGWEFTKGLPYADADRAGMVGFCFGGGVTWMVATGMPELLAAVPFYGPHPPIELVPQINAAVLGIYAGNDSRINGGIPAIEEAMMQNSKVYEKMIYPDVDHAFHNDTGTRYAPEAATDAWARTLDWFERYVRGA